MADAGEDGSTELTPDLLPYEMQDGLTTADPNVIVDLATLERGHIRRVLRQVAGNKAEAARLLGIGLTTLYRKLEEIKSL